MRKQTTRSIISFLLILSLLISPLGGMSIIANAEGDEGDGNTTLEVTQKNYTKIILKLKDTSAAADNPTPSDTPADSTDTTPEASESSGTPKATATFYADNGFLSDEHILDYSDIVITAIYIDSDNTEKEIIIDPDQTDNIYYTLELNLKKVSKTVGEDQELTAKLTYKDNIGRTVTIDSNDSGDNPKVTILESQTSTNTVKLKLKDSVKDKTFYAVNDVLDQDDTLDAEDLELTYTCESKSITDKYFDEAETDESKRYNIITETYGPISLITGQNEYTVKEKTFEITTNVDDVRKKAEANQELTAVLSYKDADGNVISFNSTDNPKISIINASSTMKLKSVSLSLADKNKKFYVDNGYMKADEILSLNDLVLTLTYDNDKTTSENLGALKSNEFTVTTNVDTIKKLVGKKQELTAKLTYKDADGKDVTITTIDSATAAKDTTKNTKATTTTVTILAPYAVNGVVTITPQNYGAKETDITSDKSAIQSALDLASADYQLVVNFPAGDYYIGNSLYIHSNTTLKLADNARIVRNSPNDDGLSATKSDREGVIHNILKIAPYGKSSASDTSTTGGYDNGVNITIDGGIFDGGKISEATSASNLLNLGHASGITIKNATFKNCYGNHLIELVAVKNAEISGCTFTGFRYVTTQITDADGTISYADSSGDLAEAIQLDVAHMDSKSAWTSAYLTDDTPCANINIHDNTFTDYPVAIGNHHALAGHHHTNITINNNIITGTKSMNSGIKLFGCDNSSASGNTITNYATGIKVSASTGFTVSNNTINTATYGIIDTDASSGQIVSNTITKLTNQGIIIYGAGTTASTVSQNKISSSSQNGIIVHSSAVCDSLKSNTISECTSCGIKVYNSGKVSTLTSNTIKNCQTSGIEVYGSASVPSLTKNTISSCNSSGIYVYSSATATTIKSNKISDCKKYGVYVTGKSSVKTLSSNTITNIKKNGIYVKNDKIKVTFKSNKLTRVGSTAIKIDSKFSNKKTQKYTFAPKVISLNLAGGVMTTQASNLKKIKLKVGSKSYTKSTKKKDYTFSFKKYTKAASSATVTFTDKNKNTVARVLDFE